MSEQPKMQQDLSIESPKELADRVSTQGDVIDVLHFRNCYKNTVIRFAGVVAMGAPGTVYYLSSMIKPDGLSPFNALAVPAAMAGGYGVNKIINARQQNEAKQLLEQTKAVQNKYKLNVEIFIDINTHEPIIRWYGQEKELSEQDLASRIISLNKLAQDSVVDKVVVPFDAVKDYLDENAENRAMLSDDWNNQQSIQTVINENDIKLIELNSSTLNDVARALESSQGISRLSKAMTTLQQVKPDHPALKFWHDGELTLDERKKLQKVLSGNISRHLDRVVAQVTSDEADYLVGGGNFTEGGNLEPRRRRALHLSGAPRLARDGRLEALYSTSQQAGIFESDSLWSELGLRKYRPDDLLDNYKTGASTDVIKACEAIAWEDLAQNNKLYEIEDAAYMPDEIVGIQARVAEVEGRLDEDEELLEMTMNRIARKLLGASSMILLGLGMQFGVKEYVDSRESQAANKLRSEGLSGAEYVEAVEDQAGLNYFDKFLGRVVNYRVGIPSWLEARSNSSSTENAEIENKPVWWIYSHNGMQSAGYWAQADFEQLSEAQYKGGSSMISWLDLDKSYFEDLQPHAEQLITPAEIDKDMPMLQVQRIVDKHGLRFSGDLIRAHDDSLELNGMLALHLPVLEGTKVVSASINGVPLKAYKDTRLERVKGESYKLIIIDADALKEATSVASEESYTIEYWLTPEKVVTEFESTKVLNYDHDQIKQMFSDNGINLIEGQSRPQETAAQIRQKFEYELSEIDDKSIASFIENTFAKGEADCEVANTLLILSDPGELKYTTGFYNSNTAEHLANNQAFLSARESHAWATDRSGNIIDATPSRDDDKYKDYFDESSIQQNMEIQKASEDKDQSPLPIKKAGIVGLLGGAVVIERRIFRPKRILRKANKPELYEALMHAFYAPGGSTYSASWQPSKTDDEADTALRQLVADEVYDNTKVQLKQAIKNAPDKYHRKYLKQAGKALKALRRA